MAETYTIGQKIILTEWWNRREGVFPSGSEFQIKSIDEGIFLLVAIKVADWEREEMERWVESEGNLPSLPDTGTRIELSIQEFEDVLKSLLPLRNES